MFVHFESVRRFPYLHRIYMDPTFVRLTKNYVSTHPTKRPTENDSTLVGVSMTHIYNLKIYPKETEFQTDCFIS